MMAITKSKLTLHEIVLKIQKAEGAPLHKGQKVSPKRMNFWTSYKGGGEVFFNPKNHFIDFGPFSRAFEHEIEKKMQYDFAKMGEAGGQRPVGTFPKI